MDVSYDIEPRVIKGFKKKGGNRNNSSGLLRPRVLISDRDRQSPPYGSIVGKTGSLGYYAGRVVSGKGLWVRTISPFS